MDFAVVVQLGRQADVLQQVDERRGQILVAQQGREPHRGYHADRHRLTVGEVGVVAQFFSAAWPMV